MRTYQPPIVWCRFAAERTVARQAASTRKTSLTIAARKTIANYSLSSPVIDLAIVSSSGSEISVENLLLRCTLLLARRYLLRRQTHCSLTSPPHHSPLSAKETVVGAKQLQRRASVATPHRTAQTISDPNMTNADNTRTRYSNSRSFTTGTGIGGTSATGLVRRARSWHGIHDDFDDDSDDDSFFNSSPSISASRSFCEDDLEYSSSSNLNSLQLATTKTQPSATPLVRAVKLGCRYLVRISIVALALLQLTASLSTWKAKMGLGNSLDVEKRPLVSASGDWSTAGAGSVRGALPPSPSQPTRRSTTERSALHQVSYQDHRQQQQHRQLRSSIGLWELSSTPLPSRATFSTSSSTSPAVTM